jgi:hypothetical protein
METPSAAKYAAATIPAVVRDAIGVIAESAKRKGCSVETFATFLQGTIFATSERSLYRWIKAVEDGATPMSAEKLSGNKLKVAWGDQMILVGWVCRKHSSWSGSLCQAGQAVVRHGYR